MMKLNKVIAILALTVLGACANTGGLFGGGSNNNPTQGAGIGDIDETTLSYFQGNVGDTVLFPVNQSTLTAAATAILNRQVAWLKTNPSLMIEVEGHADEQGTREYNRALGAKRASVVRDYLVSQGIPDARISVISYGKERPLEVCSTEACWSKNRRSVTVVTGGTGV